jgi:hypothetical protein
VIARHQLCLSVDLAVQLFMAARVPRQRLRQKTLRRFAEQVPVKTFDGSIGMLSGYAEKSVPGQLSRGLMA